MKLKVTKSTKRIYNELEKLQTFVEDYEKGHITLKGLEKAFLIGTEYIQSALDVEGRNVEEEAASAD